MGPGHLKAHIGNFFYALSLSLTILTAAPPEPQQARAITPKNRIHQDDFNAMLERRVIRVLAPHSRTLYFNDKGRERGITADNLRDFERHLNTKYAAKLGKRPLTVVIVPRTREHLLPQLAQGLGDIAAGDLIATDGQRKLVDFVTPAGAPTVQEILLTGPNSPKLSSLEDLAGKTVHVRKASSYHESLVALNQRLQKEGRPPIELIPVSEALEDEDLMEMLNAGLFEFLVVNDMIARIWGQVLPRVSLRKDLQLRSEGQLGWAIRKHSPQLQKEIEHFYTSFLKKQGVLESRLAQYHKKVKQLKNPKGGSDWKRFEQALALFEKYGKRYRFDPLMLAAQGYQESTLDQQKRSPRGAVGVMQIMPATGAELKVGDIRVIEPNIHAGAKYLDQLMTRYFPNAQFSEQDRSLFAFASYNAGPGNIAKMRNLAKQGGLDPNRWFDHVEVVTARHIGIETTTYVRNIFKYFVAYKLTLAQAEATRQAREQAEAAARTSKDRP